MKKGAKVLTLGLAAAAAVWVTAQSGAPQKGPVFQEIGGDLKIWTDGAKPSWQFGYEPGEGFNVEGSGTPVRIESPSRGLKVSSRTLKAFFKEETKGGMTFNNATLTGAVDFTQTRDAMTNIKTERAVINESADQATITLPGALTLLHKKDADSFDVKAGSGTIFLEPLKKQTEDPFRRADLKGGVTLDIKTAGGPNKDAGTSRLTGQAMDIRRQGASLYDADIEGRFNIASNSSNNDKKTTQKLTASGNTGKVSFSTEQGTNSAMQSINSLVINGGVKLEQNRTAPGKANDQGARPLEDQYVYVEADRLTYNGSTRVAVFTGNVYFKNTKKAAGTSEEPKGFEQHTEELTITFNADGSVKSIKGGGGSMSPIGGGAAKQ